MSCLVLFADDNEDLLELMTISLANDDRFSLVTLTNAEHVLDYLHFQDLGCIILDMNFGVNLTGTIMVEKILEIRDDIPIAIYTSYPADRIMSLLEIIRKHYETRIEVWDKTGIDILEIPDKIEKLIKG